MPGGHADYIREHDHRRFAQVDGAILVPIAATDGPMPQTREACLLLATWQANNILSLYHCYILNINILNYQPIKGCNRFTWRDWVGASRLFAYG